MRVPSRPWLIRLAGVAVLVGLAVWVPVKLARAGGTDRLHAMESELTGLKKGNTELQRDNDRLRREADRLKNDLDAVGAVARDELGLVKPGEVLFRIDRGNP